jgi:predicted permease
MGFRSDDVIHFAPHLESSGVDDKTAVRLLSDLLEQIRALPGVTSAAHASWIPMTNWYNGTRLEDPTTKQQFRVGVVHVSAGYFETLGLSLRSGRVFGQVDEARTDIVIVSQALASRLWPDQPALGRSMNGPDNRPLEVVGVVADCKLRDLASSREYAIYLPSSGTRSSTLVLRHSGDAQPLLAALPKLARDLDSRFLPSVEPYSVPVQKARNGSALTASIAGFVSLLALVLACVGIAGVVSYDVTRRRREIGIRMALGAHVGAILQQVLWRNLRAAAVGAVAGIGGALIVGRLLESMLYGVSPSDPVALLFTLVSLGVVALIAAWAPARRAARVDPALTLRQE